MCDNYVTTPAMATTTWCRYPRMRDCRRPNALLAEDPRIRSMRIRAWFHAVSSKSGLTAAELEREFARPDAFGRSRSCIWDKYRRGEVSPRSEPSGDGLVERVEARYADTAHWLSSPLWRLADRIPMGMFDLRQIYEGLPRPMRSLIVSGEARDASVFWRRQVDPGDVCELVVRFRSLESLIALLALVKEAETAQLQHQHDLATDACEQYLDGLAYTGRWMGRSVAEELAAYLKAKWAGSSYSYVA